MGTDLEASRADFAVDVVPAELGGQPVQTLLVVQAADEGLDAAEDGHGVGPPHPRVAHGAVAQPREVREVLLAAVRVRLEQAARDTRTQRATRITIYNYTILVEVDVLHMSLCI